MVILPDVKETSPQIHFKRTVFPEPFRPINPVILFFSIISDILFKAVVSLYFFVAFEISIIGSIFKPPLKYL